MKMDKSGLLLVAAAAAVLLVVVRKSTPAAAGAPASTGQGSIGANAGSFWSNVINNLGGTTSPSAGIGSAPVGGVTLFGNGTFDASGIYDEPITGSNTTGGMTYNTQTGAVTESPLNGMFGILSPATYGF